MKEAVVLSRADIRKILAQWYNVEEKDVLPSKYSFTVIKDSDIPDGLVHKTGTDRKSVV